MENLENINNNSVESQKKDKKNIKHFIVKLALNIVILFVFFQLGVYFASKNKTVDDFGKKEVVFLGKLTGKYEEPQAGMLSQDVDFGLFWEVWETLKKQYVDEESVSDKKLFYGAIRGMVASLGDPYTVFMDPKISKEFSDDLAGTFEGIGAEIGIKNEILTIVAPLPEMPAEKAGLKPGDKVLEINGTSTMGISIDEAVSRIRGPKGTIVKLLIAREDFNGTKEFLITRDKIVVKSVSVKFEDDIAIIKVTNFNDDTADLFNKAVEETIEKKSKGIILDLRSNPGGYLNTAIEMASEWIEEGVVVSEKYSDDRKDDHLAVGRARLSGYKTVVLVNEGSASASEIVSGALQDFSLATIVGKKTFGKGSVQTLNNFGDGSSVKVTIAKWLTPKGRSINDEGIEPDYKIDLTAEDYEAEKDPQMDLAKDVINGVEISQEILDMATSTNSATTSKQ